MKYRLNQSQYDEVIKIHFINEAKFTQDNKEFILDGDFTPTEQKQIEKLIKKFRTKNIGGWRGVKNPKKYESREECPSIKEYHNMTLRLKKELFQKARKKYEDKLTSVITAFLEKETKNVTL